MGAVERAVLIVASLLIVGGMAGVAIRELSSQTRRRVVSPARDVVEVLLPVVGAVGLVVLVWVFR